LGYTLTIEFATRTKDELIEDILGSFEWDYLIENGYVEKIEEGDEE
jgi:hypothetical protein